jgi:nitroreductase
VGTEIGLFEAIDSQRALRYIKPDPVPDELIRRVLEAAIKAPSGGNSQPWEFLVIRDPQLRAEIGGFYKRSWDAAYGDAAGRAMLSGRVYRSAAHLAAHMADVPVLLMACVRTDGTPGGTTRGSSIYPAVQNMLLAARGLGLASALTTLHKRYESEIKGLLAVPDDVETAALLPLGYPQDGVSYGPAKRRPLDEVVHFDRW